MHDDRPVGDAFANGPHSIDTCARTLRRSSASPRSARVECAATRSHRLFQALRRDRARSARLRVHNRKARKNPGRPARLRRRASAGRQSSSARRASEGCRRRSQRVRPCDRTELLAQRVDVEQRLRRMRLRTVARVDDVSVETPKPARSGKPGSGWRTTMTRDAHRAERQRGVFDRFTLCQAQFARARGSRRALPAASRQG